MYASTVPSRRPGGSGQKRHYVNLDALGATLTNDRAARRQRGTARAVDSRLLRYAWAAAPGDLAAAVGLGIAGTALILAQAGLLAHALATAARGSATVAALGSTLLALLAVVMARAAVTYGGEVAALRAAATVKSRLRRALADRSVRLGPVWLGGQRTGEIAALATKGLDGLDPYFARYLPQLVLAVVVPIAVLARVAVADWISAVVIAVTLPLIPVFAVLVGWHTKAQTRRQWRLLATLAGHFLDVVEGLPTLKVFGRAKAQEKVIENVTSTHRAATMSTLRVAFLSALVLELTAAVATALVAVEVGLRLLHGQLGYETALVVLLLTPEAYLPLRAVGAQFHASMEGAAAAGRVFEILDTPATAQVRPVQPACPADQAERGYRGLSRPEPPGSGWGEHNDPAGGTGRPDRAERRGQEFAAGAAAPVHRAGRRDDTG
jgi:ABC-type transport system involved in cytochrome bd biosynthesis fused ATPase/permease subunit